MINRVPELYLRIEPNKWFVRDTPSLKVPCAINQTDRLSDSRTFRLISVIDGFNSAGLTVEADLAFLGARVVRALDQLITWHGTRECIRCDNDP